MTTIYRNTIQQFVGSWSSGLATLVFEQGNSVHCDNGATARALDSAFDCIAPGHSIDNDKLVGKDIAWAYGEFGLTLGGFMPYDEYLLNDNPEIELGMSIELN